MFVCKRCVAWVLSLSLLWVMVSGCDGVVSVSPEFESASFEAPSFQVVTGSLDGVDTDFKTDDFLCNPDDVMLYRIADGSAVLNTDSTQVECEPVSLVRFEVAETTRPLYVDA